LRIAFVAPFGLRAKGTTRARCLPLASALAARGHTIALFVPPYDSPDDSGRFWQVGGVDVVNVSLPGSGAGLGAFDYVRVAWRLLRALRRWDPDLVHVFKPKGPSGLIGAAMWQMRLTTGGSRHRASDRGCRPLIVVDADDWEGPGGWNDDPRAAYSTSERRFFAWQERYGLSHADAWTVASDCLRDRAIHFGADAVRVFVLPNGVSTSNVPFTTSPGSVSAEEVISPSVGVHPPSAILYTRFAGFRIESVVAVWDRVRAIEPGARLTVLGRGLGGEEDALRFVPGVDVLGWVEHNELHAKLATAQLAVVPWDDTPSNRARHSVKVLELMLAGLPIVGYAVGELPSTVGDAGVLVEPDDQAGLARAIAGLLHDRDLAHRLGAMARSRVVERFTWERLVQTVLVAYDAAGTAPNGS
jgi:glycosyltransferase involved in cell wall biosynthesis